MIANWRWVVPALLAVLTAGCQEELGPEVFPTARVRGSVRQGRRPVARGWVEFNPMDGAVGNIRSAPIHSDGSFEVSGVAIGPNAIILVNVAFDQPGGRTFRTIQCPDPREITAGPATTLTFDTIEESLRQRH